MRYIITMTAILVMLVGCGPDRDIADDTSMTNDEPAGTPVDEGRFTMVGELKEIDDDRLLIDLDNQGLTWVTVEDSSDLDIDLGSRVQVVIVGGIMESYPGQASGESVVVIEEPEEPSGETQEEPAQEPLYSLSSEIYSDEDRDIYIEYFQARDMVGQLVQDYANQSLYRVVETFGANDYESVRISARILRQDDYLTVIYEGTNEAMNYPIWQVISLHMPTSAVLSPDNVIADQAAFEEIFGQISGFVYTELEGVQVYMDHGKLTFTFVPPDDTAVRQQVPFDLDIYEQLFRFDFEMPAS